MTDNKNNKEVNNLTTKQKKVKYEFYFRCSACGRPLKNGSNSFHEINGVFVENDLCPECASSAYDTTYSYEFVQGHLTRNNFV